jgi:hypothetical protein
MLTICLASKSSQIGRKSSEFGRKSSQTSNKFATSYKSPNKATLYAQGCIAKKSNSI